MSDVWVYDKKPTTPGWYAVLICWDVQEGLIPSTAFWRDGSWVREHPYVAHAGPFDTSDAAYKHAWDNDPEGI